MSYKLSQQDRESMATLYSCGIAGSTLAGEYGLSGQRSVMRIAKQAGKTGLSKGERFANAICVYRTISNNNIKGYIEKYIFSPMAEEVKHSILELVRPKIHSPEEKLLAAIFTRPVKIATKRDIFLQLQEEAANVAMSEIQKFIQNSSPQSDLGYKWRMKMEVERRSTTRLLQTLKTLEEKVQIL